MVDLRLPDMLNRRKTCHLRHEHRHERQPSLKRGIGTVIDTATSTITASRRNPNPSQSLLKLKLKMFSKPNYRSIHVRALGFAIIALSLLWPYSKSIYHKCRKEIKEQQHHLNHLQLPLPWIPKRIDTVRKNKNVRTDESIPLVCIVVTAYNVEQYIEQALDSIFQQKYDNIHVIAVDDASTDDTPNIIGHYAQAFPNAQTEAQTNTIDSYDTFGSSKSKKRLRLIRLLQNTNGGTGQPTNIGIDACPKDSVFVMLLDGDDYTENSSIQIMVHNAQIYNSDLVVAGFDTFTERQDANETTLTKTTMLEFTKAYDEATFSALPMEQAFHILSNIEALHISPVPWRKLYRYSFLSSEENLIRFPEGDYFFEDNTFHWLVMAHATRVSKVNQVLFHHRQRRKGQTSSIFNGGNLKRQKWWDSYSDTARLAGMLATNMYRTGMFLFQRKINHQRDRTICSNMLAHDVWGAFFKREKGVNHFVLSKIREGLQISEWYILDWFQFPEYARMRQALIDKLQRIRNQHTKQWMKTQDRTNIYNSGPVLGFLRNRREHEIDISLVLATRNAATFLPVLLQSLYSELSSSSVTFEVIAVDDESSDSTRAILRNFGNAHISNFCVLQTNANVGPGLSIGRTRNQAIPLAEGRFVYFVDAYDTDEYEYDFRELANAVNVAKKQNVDLLLFPDQSDEHTSSNGSPVRSDQPSSQEAGSQNVADEYEQTHHGKKQDSNMALRLNTHPRKQLTSCTMLRDTDIFFGPTASYNNIQFHWTSIAAARSIYFHSKRIAVHREKLKFDPSTHRELVKHKDEARMLFFDALGLTQRALALQGAFDDLEGAVSRDVGSNFAIWQDFCGHLLQSVSTQIPEDYVSKFDRRKKRFINALAKNESSFRSFAYWE